MDFALNFAESDFQRFKDRFYSSFVKESGELKLYVEWKDSGIVTHRRDESDAEASMKRRISVVISMKGVFLSIPEMTISQ